MKGSRPPPIAEDRIPVRRADRIRYDPRLIDTLLRDHAELGRLLARVGEAGKAGEAGEARSLLLTFKARLKAHVAAENARFYDYLEQSLARDPELLRMLRNYRREMARIARDVLAFVHKYQASTFPADERRRFIADHVAIGRELEHRLDSEEDTLYRLYRED